MPKPWIDARRQDSAAIIFLVLFTDQGKKIRGRGCPWEGVQEGLVLHPSQTGRTMPAAKR